MKLLSIAIITALSIAAAPVSFTTVTTTTLAGPITMTLAGASGSFTTVENTYVPLDLGSLAIDVQPDTAADLLYQLDFLLPINAAGQNGAIDFPVYVSMSNTGWTARLSARGFVDGYAFHVETQVPADGSRRELTGYFAASPEPTDVGLCGAGLLLIALGLRRRVRTL